MYIQDDPVVNGYRIWYSTDSTLYAASYSTFSQTVVFEEIVYSEPIAGVDTPIHMRDGNLLFGSISSSGSSEGADTMNYFSLLGCPHGTQVSYDTLISGAKVNYGCTAC